MGYRRLSHSVLFFGCSDSFTFRFSAQNSDGRTLVRQSMVLEWLPWLLAAVVDHVLIVLQCGAPKRYKLVYKPH